MIRLLYLFYLINNMTKKSMYYFDMFRLIISSEGCSNNIIRTVLLIKNTINTFFVNFIFILLNLNLLKNSKLH